MAPTGWTMPHSLNSLAVACLLGTLCSGCTSNKVSDAQMPWPGVAAELRYTTPAYLRLVAETWPDGGPYDRAYWTIALECSPFMRNRGRPPIWETTLNPYHDAGPVTDEAPWGGPPLGDYVAEVRITEDGIAIYLPWSEESMLLTRRGGIVARTPGRRAFDAAQGETARLAVNFAPNRSGSTHAQFTSGAGLITGVPGNLSDEPTSRPSAQP